MTKAKQPDRMRRIGRSGLSLGAEVLIRGVLARLGRDATVEIDPKLVLTIPRHNFYEDAGELSWASPEVEKWVTAYGMNRSNADAYVPVLEWVRTGSPRTDLNPWTRPSPARPEKEPMTPELALRLRDEAVRRAEETYQRRLAQIEKDRAERASRIEAARTQMALSQLNKVERESAILARKAEGASHKEIAQAFGLSVPRIKQILAVAQNRKDDTGPPPLSARAVNCLLLDQIPIDPAEVAKHSAAELLRIPNMGRKTLTEIEVWLDYHDLEIS